MTLCVAGFIVEASSQALVRAIQGIKGVEGSLVPGSLYIFSRDLTYLIACGQGPLERRLHFILSARDIVLALGLWHKQALKSRCKKLGLLPPFLV